MGRGNLAANERVLIVSAAARCHDECGMLATTVEQSSIERRRSMAQGSRGEYAAARRLDHDGCCVRAVVSGIDRSWLNRLMFDFFVVARSGHLTCRASLELRWERSFVEA